MAAPLSMAGEYAIVWQPHDAAEAWRLKQTYGPDCEYIAGGTWLAVQWENESFAMPRHLIDLASIPGVRGIAVLGDELFIGSLTSLNVLRSDPLVASEYPLVTEAIRTIAAPSIRNLATIGGNVGSRTGDLLPALLLYEAELLWHDGHSSKWEPVSEWLEQSKDVIRQQGRILLQLKLKPSSHRGQVLAYYEKVGRREAFTPSVVTCGFVAEIEGACTCRKVSRIRITAGGGLMKPVRLPKSEVLLVGKALEPQLMEQFYEQLVDEIEPAGDLFVSTAYRKQTAANLIAAGLWQKWQRSEG
ncbi:xanthine dehydrogenase family protein subunit M [Paenibacillus sp. OV219]|uniref:FAD binding domain-containing protein n=1 Tax=Paenibacillus sp. OV219 TaxID=1884377 RepID=UPI0008ACEB21|nr:FAD binding domain-containing protein [Paenibacillus sp. OV219]SEM86578.1 carbon-monoxide dehydrogenase medium subunit [Paenibacillus sp. OV219]